MPKIFKTLTIIEWSEAFACSLRRVIGEMMIPPVHVTREHVVVVPNAASPVVINQLHSNSTDHGSVEGGLTARASHEHAQFVDANEQVCHCLEEAT